MLNDLIIYFTDFYGKLRVKMNSDKYIREKDDIRFVFYHGIGDGLSPCMRYLNDEIAQSVFIEHLDYLKEKYIILSCVDIFELINSGNISSSKPYCNLSFDDGLSTVYSKAFPLLKERSISFDVFLNTSVIGNTRLLWLHLLNYLFSTYGFDEMAKTLNEYCDIDVTKIFKNESDIEIWLRKNFEYVYNSRLFEKIINRFGLNLKQIANDQNVYLDREQIDEMSCYGVGFYSHTHSHFPLNVFSDENVIKNEIETAYKFMKSKNVTSDIFVSFPFGMENDYGKKAIKFALTAGHKFVVEVGDGLNQPERIIDNKIISRVCLGGISADRASLYSAIEVRPILKNRLKKLMQ